MANHDTHAGHDHAEHGHGEHGHPKFLHHHFDTPLQQFDSDKLGMWLFLMTEILMFGGLFCAYAVYRANHPEVFIYAHQFLDKTLGGINTVVLISSSFTMAWAVRAAQLNQRKLLVTLLALTLLGGFGFMAIKSVEYNHKWKHGLLWGARYQSQGVHAEDEAAAAGEHGAADADGVSGAEHGAAGAESQQDSVPTGTGATDTGQMAEHDAAAGETPAEGGETAAEGDTAPQDLAQRPLEANAATTLAAGASISPGTPPLGQAAAELGLVIETSNIKPAARGPAGLADSAALQATHGAGAEQLDEPRNVNMFFAIYFAMTGLHALHVLAGMVVIFIVMVLSAKGRFNSEYYTPVDLVGLFWHLVDLIWIFLFPLLYLIH